MFGNYCVVSLKKALDSLSVSVLLGFNIARETVRVSAPVKFSFRSAEQKLLPGWFCRKCKGFFCPHP